MDIFEKIQEIAGRDGDKRIAYTEGTLAKLGNKEAFSLRYSQNGTAVARGFVKSTTTFGQNQQDNYFVTFVAFGDTAEAMSDLSEGDRVQLLTERRRRKFNDKWYEEDIVIAFARA